MTLPLDLALRLLFTALAMGAMTAMAASMLRAPRPLQRWVGVMFDLSVGAYAFKLWNDAAHLVGPPVLGVVISFAGCSIGWFWLFMMVLFTDRCALGWRHYAPVVALFVLGETGFLAPEPWQGLVWGVRNVGQLGLAAHTLFLVVRGWKGDLVEVRRRMRGPFLVTVAVYIIVQRALELLASPGGAPGWYELANTATLALVCVFGAFVFLDARLELFGVGAPAAPQPAGKPATGDALSPDGLDRAARADLDRIEKLMTADEIWREEGLTIASLALKANIPETQLRRLINDHLGFRNFPSFVNARRIAAAQARLSDPHEARTSISAIAYDIGFGSLGPFNRAFREATGKSPSEWRREALNGGADSAGEAPADASPISRPA